jgi:hypothetical protein
MTSHWQIKSKQKNSYLQDLLIDIKFIVLFIETKTFFIGARRAPKSMKF